jgi:hypothetical protein
MHGFRDHEQNDGGIYDDDGIGHNGGERMTKLHKIGMYDTNKKTLKSFFYDHTYVFVQKYINVLSYIL